MRRQTLLLMFCGLMVPSNAYASWEALEESFLGSRLQDTRWELMGSSALTAGRLDPEGDGWLRLTNAESNQRGVAY